jgi:hypothetical protein
MVDPKILKFYARKDIQNEIAKLAKDRELAVRYSNGGFGKRPDVLQYPSDVLELARQGVSSFHVSEERWSDPLLLRSGMSKKQLDELRSGWDLVLDIDTNFFEFSKAAAALIVEALKFYDVSNVGVKFSGRSGFHLLVPFEAFPSSVNGQDTRLLFPDGARNIALHLKDLIEKPLRDHILSLSSVDELKKALGDKSSELMKNGKLNPFSVVDIDSVLISSRHMFRSVYSINEKSGLVSVPVKLDQIKNFQLQQAKMENVSVDIPFVVQPVDNEAKHLIIEAFDKASKIEHTYIPDPKTEFSGEKKSYEIPKVKVQDEVFPECMVKALQGMESDGRKRAVFVLIGFLRNMGYTFDEVLERLLEWNKKNYEELREGYIRSQVSWHKRQKETLPPPGCANKSYYPIVGGCTNCKSKNAVSAVHWRLKLLKQQEKKKRKAPLIKKKIKKSPKAK